MRALVASLLVLWAAAAAWAQSPMDEKTPANLADWTLKDVKQARELVASLSGKS